MKIIDRKDLPKDYSDMMRLESHHDHKIVEDERGVLRWEADPFISRFVDDCSLNNIAQGFYANGSDKNTESYRELYRRMGYSLSGYWEVFHWEMNNDIAHDYKQPEQV